MELDYISEIDSLIEELNRKIDIVIEEKQRLNIDYSLLERIMLEILKSTRYIKEQQTSYIIPIKKEEIIKIALDFFKSVDIDFYKKALKVLMQQHNNIETNVYNVNEIVDFDEVDEKGFLKYTERGNVTSEDFHAVVHVPIQEGISEYEANIIGLKSDIGTVEDIYTLVHEISHLFDLDLKMKPTQEHAERAKISREFIGESTTIAFEQMLTQYLLDNKLFPQDIIREYEIFRSNGIYTDTKIAYTELLLSRIKEKDGEITREKILDIMKEKGLSYGYALDILKRVIDNNMDINYKKRYVLARLISPTIMKTYKTDGANAIKEYLELAKDGDYEGALKRLGITMDKNGMNELIRNMRKYDRDLDKMR